MFVRTPKKKRAMKPKHHKPLIAMAVVALTFTAKAPGATIAYFNQVEGNEVTDWRTTSTNKSLDIDGDNFYGTYAAVNWGQGSTNEQGAAPSTPGWAYIAGGGQFTNAGFTDIDHITNFPTDGDAGIILGSFTFELTGTASTYLGQTVRIGVMQDMLSAGEWANDTFKGLQFVQTVGAGSGDSGIISVRAGAAGDGVPEMYFFDLTNVTAGDQFQILALNGQGGPATQAGYLGPISFDVVPEPSTALLGALGLLALLRRRR
jgi:hypothetical protein